MTGFDALIVLVIIIGFFVVCWTLEDYGNRILGDARRHLDDDANR